MSHKLSFKRKMPAGSKAFDWSEREAGSQDPTGTLLTTGVLAEGEVRRGGVCQSLLIGSSAFKPSGPALLTSVGSVRALQNVE